MNKYTKKYFHWKWQRRWNKAWKRANRRANSGTYREWIGSYNPYTYFGEELSRLKNK